MPAGHSGRRSRWFESACNRQQIIHCTGSIDLIWFQSYQYHTAEAVWVWQNYFPDGFREAPWYFRCVPNTFRYNPFFKTAPNCFVSMTNVLAHCYISEKTPNPWFWHVRKMFFYQVLENAMQFPLCSWYDLSNPSFQNRSWTLCCDDKPLGALLHFYKTRNSCFGTHWQLSQQRNAASPR